MLNKDNTGTWDILHRAADAAPDLFRSYNYELCTFLEAITMCFKKRTSCSTCMDGVFDLHFQCLVYEC